MIQNRTERRVSTELRAGRRYRESALYLCQASVSL